MVLAFSDLGHRVVVRRYAGVGPEGRPRYTDLLGELMAIDDDRVVVRGDDGADRIVPVREISAAKRVPPRPVRHSEIIALEHAADAAWPAPVREPLGDWLLRAADGWTNRANSALALGNPGRPLDEAIDDCVAWYDARGLPPKLTVPVPPGRRIVEALTDRGWIAQPVVLVQTAALTDVLAAAPVERDVILHETPTPEFLDIVGARKQSLPAAAHAVLTGPPDVRFAEVRDEGARVVALARAAVVDGWMHLGVVEVRPEARRRGLARRVTAALARWAATAGATRAVLQVEAHNEAAVALYAAMAFTTHHRYTTHRRPP